MTGMEIHAPGVVVVSHQGVRPVVVAFPLHGPRPIAGLRGATHVLAPPAFICTADQFQTSPDRHVAGATWLGLGTTTNQRPQLGDVRQSPARPPQVQVRAVVLSLLPGHSTGPLRLPLQSRCGVRPDGRSRRHGLHRRTGDQSHDTSDQGQGPGDERQHLKSGSLSLYPHVEPPGVHQPNWAQAFRVALT